jgi:hypothetical protein
MTLENRLDMEHLRALLRARPYLAAILVGLVFTFLATALDALVSGDWNSEKTFAPQAVVLSAPVISTYWTRRKRGIRSTQDRAGLWAVIAVAAVLMVTGVIVVVRGLSAAQIVLGVVVVLLGAVLGFIGLSQMPRPQSISTN